MAEISVLFFATLKDRAGVDRVSLEWESGGQVVDLKARLEARFPELAPALTSALVSVNREYAFDEDEIPEGAEVALFPPVSGGADPKPPTRLLLTDEPLDLNELLQSITRPATGAACIFTGMVRAETRRGQPHRTEYLEYETYREMALEKMGQVADEIRKRWSAVAGIAIVQRVGRLYPGTPTVLIACTAGHRDTGVFEAARYGIDRLKEIVPIWKKEVGPEGEAWVEGSYFPGPGE